MITTGVSKSSNIRKHPHYYRIVYNTGTILHNHGALQRLLTTPERYNPSFIAISKSGGFPVSIASATLNEKQEGMMDVGPSYVDGKPFEYNFPNIEIMAYTDGKYRNKGLSLQTVRTLLDKLDIPVDYTIYVYSDTMKRIVERLGYTKVVNLHGYTT